MRSRTLPLLITLCFATASNTLASDAKNFPVVDGSRQATIVYAEDAVDEPVKGKKTSWYWHKTHPADAYRELAEYVHKVTGKELQAVREDQFHPGDGKFPIYVGNCKLTREVLGKQLKKLDRDGFIILVQPSRMFLAGPTKDGTFWAVCQFIEDYLGVRWLIPGPLGEDFRKSSKVVLSPRRIVEEPKILSRRWSGWYKHFKNLPEGDSLCRWSLRHRVRVTSWDERYAFHHNLYRIFPPEKYYSKHPEFYPIRDGKRPKPSEKKQNWQICMTNPDTVKIAADHARSLFNDPDYAYRDACSFGSNDSGNYCQCPKCLALMPKSYDPTEMPASYSEYSRMYYSWLTKVGQELGKTHPHKLLGCLAYYNNTSSPKGIKLNRNILPYICFTIADMYRPSYRDSAKRLIASWGKQVDQIGYYDYAYGIGNVLPRIYIHTLQEMLQFGVEHNLSGVYSEVHPNFGLDAPQYYIIAKLWWDPYIDVDQVFDEWNDRMFRESSVPMKRFFRRCESAWKNYRGFWARDEWPSNYRIFWRTPPMEVYTPQVIDECSAYLDDAARLAKSDLVRRRVRFFHKCWRAGVEYADAYWPSRKVRDLIRTNAPIAQVADALAEIPNTPTEKELLSMLKQRMDGHGKAFCQGVYKGTHWLPAAGVRLGWRTAQVPDATTGPTKTLPWFVERITPPALEQLARGGNLNAESLGKLVNERIGRLFQAEGSNSYKKAVQHLRVMATKSCDAPKVAVAPKIDGLLNDAAWAKSQSLDGFTVVGSDLVASQYAVAGKIAWDDKNLYVAFDCPRQKTSSRVPKIQGEVTMSGIWHILGPFGPFTPDLSDLDKHPVPDAKLLKSVLKTLSIADQTRSAKEVKVDNGLFDLEKVYSKRKKAGLTYYVFTELNCPKTQNVTFGMGADWWMQVWLDGREIFNNTGTITGNVFWPASIANYQRTVKVTKGRHVLAVRFIRGSGSAGLALGGPAELRKIPRKAWVDKVKDFTTWPRPPKRDGPVDRGDYVGLSIQNPRKPGSSAYIVINPDGALADQRGGDKSFDFDCRYAVKVEPTRWSVELSLPLKQLGIDPAKDRVLRMNMVHSVFNWHIATWFPEPTRGPHWANKNTGWVFLQP